MLGRGALPGPHSQMTVLQPGVLHQLLRVRVVTGFHGVVQEQLASLQASGVACTVGREEGRKCQRLGFPRQLP